MSTLRVDAIRHNSATSDAITTAADGTCTAKLTSVGGGQLSHRNLIINGAMTISQRTTSSSTVGAGSGYSVMDRFKTNNDLPSGVSNLTLSQDSDAPAGFSKSYKVTPNQAGTLADSDRFFLSTSLEAQDIRNSGWNYTDSNSKLTLSFYIKSNLTGIVSLELNSPDSPSTKRHFRSTVTINSANTWERKTVTIPGDSQLVFDDNNEPGLHITWQYASGPNFSSGTHVTGSWDTTAVAGNRSSSSNINIYSNTSNFVSLTGVQLEVGDTATTFEHRSFADELRRCQRYFFAHSGANINGSNSSTPDSHLGTCSCMSTSGISFNVVLPVPMRTVPTLYSTVTGSTRYRVNSAGANVNSGSDPVIYVAGSNHILVSHDLSGFSGLQSGQSGNIRRYQGSGVLGYSAEL